MNKDDAYCVVVGMEDEGETRFSNDNDIIIDVGCCCLKKNCSVKIKDSTCDRVSLACIVRRGTRIEVSKTKKSNFIMMYIFMIFFFEENIFNGILLRRNDAPEN